MAVPAEYLIGYTILSCVTGHFRMAYSWCNWKPVDLGSGTNNKEEVINDLGLIKK